MANDNNPNQDQKRGFPASFLIFILLAIFVVVLIQNYSSGKIAKVSFSYELEHLVNLDLIRPEESRKIAVNDNFVTFSGQFRDKETDEGKKRYKFLNLLDVNHTETIKKDQLAQELTTERADIREAADWYLHLSGISIPVDGYHVVDATYDTPDQINNITIASLSDKSIVNLPALHQKFETVKDSLSSNELYTFGSELLIYIQNLRSPHLGIGNEVMKQTLKSLYTDILNANSNAQLTPNQLSIIYSNALTQVSSIVSQLNQETDHVRLAQLRSVRNYREDIEQYAQVSDTLEQNKAQLDKARASVANVIWYFNNKQLSTKALESQDAETYSHWYADANKEWNDFNENKGAFFKAPDQPMNLVLEKTFKSEEPAPNYLSYLFTFLPVLLVAFLIYFVFSRQMKGVGGSAMNFGKSPAKLLTKANNRITFKDVAGIDEAKEELQEIVEFLKSPGKFTALGARIPKGVLCVGPPGTGKTLLAKAVAGEADRPFFSISGSDFVEMFVGVGASRIRDLFDQAKKNAPCLIFMDEIDAVGRHRGAGIGGGHDEREQTLNQLLVEMDGFDSNEGVILMAATNRPDVLDKALLRPGRFDRRVVIDLPDLKGRFEILKVHARKIKIDPSVDLMSIARATPGCAGADLANLLNEAALMAAGKGRTAVTAQETMEACDKVRYGKERRSLELDDNEKLTTAYHEAGHAVVSLVVKHSDPVEKVTIIPRGLSLGATHFLPKKNRLSYWKAELNDQMAVLMGGRCAEEIFVGDMSSGAQQDIDQATRLARAMVCEWGMNDSLGLVTYDKRNDGGQYLGMTSHDKNYSESTAEKIDAEVKKLTEAGYLHAKNLLLQYREQTELMARMLIEFETLDADDVLKIMNGQWTSDDKKERLKKADEAHKKQPISPPPPPPIIDKDRGGETLVTS
ncbi:MAG: ATP-dependent zinc metalloprotease FtsH [Parachlamydiales bacterium]|nr:ATP-dependent zinc metalloprotease FtsH [Parachlamydiales bacterium]